jgi:superfamily I DNA/RNA helicase
VDTSSFDAGVNVAVERVKGWVKEPTDSADTASGDAIRIATMHRAKGLEFDRVVVLALKGIAPAGGTDLAQLAYVSLTRAKTGAVLVR